MHFSKPEVVGNSDAGAVISTETTPSTATISIKELGPKLGATFTIPLHVPEALAGKVLQTWREKMFDPEFSKTLVANLSCGGENARTVDAGFVKAPTMLPPEDVRR